MKRITISSAILSLVFSFSHFAQNSGGSFTPDGISISEAGPRNGHSMAYDHETGEVLLFGGADHEKVVDDLFVLRSNA
ncbi:MAG: hypothetical protein IPM63_12070 [Acidobacteriota bacterium]|nr:MAG: hypothetical protein IPM63_12070 [Acidobacteriota bacterium]